MPHVCPSEEPCYDPDGLSEADEESGSSEDDVDELTIQAPSRAAGAQRGRTATTPGKRRKRHSEDQQAKSTRREKNREAARRCRKRKQDVVLDLESQLSVALDEYAQLEHQAGALQAAIGQQAACNTALKFFLRVHGSQPFSMPSHTPLAPEALLELEALLNESATNSPSSPAQHPQELSWEQPHIIKPEPADEQPGAHALPLAPKPPPPTKARPASRAHASQQRSRPRTSSSRPHKKPAPQRAYTPTAAAVEAPPAVAAVPSSTANQLPPPTLTFDFTEAPDNQAPCLHFPQHSALSAPSPLPHSQPHTGPTATPNTNLKLLADQAMQKLLHPSPYIHRAPHYSSADQGQLGVGRGQGPEAHLSFSIPPMLPEHQQEQEPCPAIAQALTALQPTASGTPPPAALTSGPSCMQLESLQELWDV